MILKLKMAEDSSSQVSPYFVVDITKRDESNEYTTNSNEEVQQSPAHYEEVDINVSNKSNEKEKISSASIAASDECGDNTKRVLSVIVMVAIFSLLVVALICFIVIFARMNSIDQQLSILLHKTQSLSESVNKVQQLITAQNETERVQLSVLSILLNETQLLSESAIMNYQQLLLTVQNESQLLKTAHNETEHEQLSVLSTLLNETRLLSESVAMNYQQLLLTVQNDTRGVISQNNVNLAASCAALSPSSPSGYYWVNASKGSAVRVYCDMTRSCGNVICENTHTPPSLLVIYSNLERWKYQHTSLNILFQYCTRVGHL